MVLWALPVRGEAQVVPPPGIAEPPPAPPPGGVVARDQRLVISSSLCRELAPEGVPGADYVAGVDVQGRPVAPADLPGSGSAPQTGNYPIEIDARLQHRFGVAASSRLFADKGVVGFVTVREGRAYFNGEPLSNSERDMFLAACRAARR
jgi:hypothetical protein